MTTKAEKAFHLAVLAAEARIDQRVAELEEVYDTPLRGYPSRGIATIEIALGNLHSLHRRESTDGGALSGKTHQDRLLQVREASSRLRERRRAARLCLNCGEPLYGDDISRCAPCRAKVQARRRQLRAERK